MKLEKITFAGHAATFVHFDDGLTVAIDPWLEGNPKCPKEFKKPNRLDLIVLTHGHADHASEAVSLAKHYGCEVIATYELVNVLTREGLPQDKGHGMNKGGTLSWKTLSVTLTHAFHSSSYDTAQGAVYAGEACGVVLRDDTHSIYHAGDTCLFSDMNLIREQYHPDVALLPIGDVFTMGPSEAAKAASLLGCKRAIPIHYGTFDLLTGTAEEFSRACQQYDVEAIALQPGESLTL